jgi:transposase-like protein
MIPTPVLIAVPLVLIILALRWAFFARVGLVHTPFCPICRESRGRFLGVGERSGRRYYRCPHCGNTFEEDGTGSDGT